MFTNSIDDDNTFLFVLLRWYISFIWVFPRMSLFPDTSANRVDISVAASAGQNGRPNNDVYPESDGRTISVRSTRSTVPERLHLSRWWVLPPHASRLGCRCYWVIEKEN